MPLSLHLTLTPLISCVLFHLLRKPACCFFLRAKSALSSINLGSVLHARQQKRRDDTSCSSDCSGKRTTRFPARAPDVTTRRTFMSILCVIHPSFRLLAAHRCPCLTQWSCEASCVPRHRRTIPVISLYLISVSFEERSDRDLLF